MKDICKKQAGSSGKKTVLIVEFDHSGHRLHYVRMFAESLIDHVDKVVVLLSNSAFASDEFKIHLEGLRSKVHFLRVPESRVGGVLKYGMRLIALGRYVRQMQPDRVYLPYGDGLTQFATLFGYRWWFACGRIPHEVVLMRGSYAYPLGASIKSRIARKLNGIFVGYSPWNRIHFLDPLVFEYMANSKYPIAKRSYLLPEPLEPLEPPASHEQLCKDLGLDPKYRYVVSVGSHTLRKGTHLLMDAFCAANLPDDVRLLVAGKLSREMKALFAGAEASGSSDIIVFDEYIGDDVFLKYLDLAQVVAAPYLGHVGSSGIVARAILRKKIVVGSSFGWVGKLLEQYENGFACSESVADLCGALESCFKHRPLGEGSAFSDDFVAFHTMREFEACIQEGLVG
jgi:glycosyltransferase involved in cell wall biosynthesis